MKFNLMTLWIIGFALFANVASLAIGPRPPVPDGPWIPNHFPPIPPIPRMPIPFDGNPMSPPNIGPKPFPGPGPEAIPGPFPSPDSRSIPGPISQGPADHDGPQEHVEEREFKNKKMNLNEHSRWRHTPVVNEDFAEGSADKESAPNSHAQQSKNLKEPKNISNGFPKDHPVGPTNADGTVKTQANNLEAQMSIQHAKNSAVQKRNDDLNPEGLNKALTPNNQFDREHLNMVNEKHQNIPPAQLPKRGGLIHPKSNETPNALHQNNFENPISNKMNQLPHGQENIHVSNENLKNSNPPNIPNHNSENTVANQPVDLSNQNTAKDIGSVKPSGIKNEIKNKNSEHNNVKADKQQDINNLAKQSNDNPSSHDQLHNEQTSHRQLDPRQENINTDLQQHEHRINRFPDEPIRPQEPPFPPHPIENHSPRENLPMFPPVGGRPRMPPFEDARRPPVPFRFNVPEQRLHDHFSSNGLLNEEKEKQNNEEKVMASIKNNEDHGNKNQANKEMKPQPAKNRSTLSKSVLQINEQDINNQEASSKRVNDKPSIITPASQKTALKDVKDNKQASTNSDETVEAKKAILKTKDFGKDSTNSALKESSQIEKSSKVARAAHVGSSEEHKDITKDQSKMQMNNIPIHKNMVQPNFGKENGPPPNLNNWNSGHPKDLPHEDLHHMDSRGPAHNEQWNHPPERRHHMDPRHPTPHNSRFLNKDVGVSIVKPVRAQGVVIENQPKPDPKTWLHFQMQIDKSGMLNINVGPQPGFSEGNVEESQNSKASDSNDNNKPSSETRFADQVVVPASAVGKQDTPVFSFKSGELAPETKTSSVKKNNVKADSNNSHPTSKSFNTRAVSLTIKADGEKGLSVKPTANKLNDLPANTTPIKVSSADELTSPSMVASKIDIDNAVSSGCPALSQNCNLKCPGHLFKLNENTGCPQCECCPTVNCTNICKKGFKADVQGCPTCKCID